MIAVVALWLGLSMVVLSLWGIGVSILRRHPMKCSNPECSGRAWWRLFLVLHDSTGKKMIAKMPTPYRLCGPCFHDLDPDTARPERPMRRAIAKALRVRHGHVVDWTKTRAEREHVFSAWLRRIGTRRAARRS